VDASLRRDGQETTLGRYAIANWELAQIPRQPGMSVVLRLAQSDVLAKTLVLPVAAERQLDRVLALEMDRETPFAPEELVWTQRIMQRDRRLGRIWVRLLLLPRAKLTQLLQALDQAGIRPLGAEIAAGPDQGAYLAFEGHDERSNGPARQWLGWAALVCCAALALAAITIPLMRQAVALANIESKMTADRIAAAEAQKLRQEIDRLSSNVNLIENERAKRGRPLTMLGTLTRLLPADTYLTDFVQQQRKVTLSGRSAAATRLIAKLSDGEQLRNASFTAPVTRIEMNQLEIFTITVEVVP
jgi:general secretion pathway protein L